MSIGVAPAPEHTSGDTPGRLALDPIRLLRLEGVATAIAAVGLYTGTGAGWWLFAGLLLVPDLGMLGYLASARLGAATYNLTHTFLLPLVVAGVGLLVASSTVVAVALVWIAHIGIDRAFGYGLKQSTGFGETHLGRVGRS